MFVSCCRLAQSIRQLHGIFVRAWDRRHGKDRIGEVLLELRGVEEAIAKSLSSSSSAAAAVVGDGNSSSAALPAPVPPSIKELLAARELQYDRVMLELKLLDVRKGAATSTSLSSSSKLLPGTKSALMLLGFLGTAEEDRTLEAMVLADTNESRKTLEHQKLEASTARAYLDSIYTNHEQRQRLCRADMQGVEGTIASLSAHRLDLLRQVAATEQQLEAERRQLGVFQDSLAKMQERHETQVGALDASHGHVLSSAKKESALQQLVELVHSFERCFEDTASSVTAASSPKAQPPCDVSPRSVDDYLAAEGNFIAFIARRVKLMEMKILNLHRERKVKRGGEG